MLGKWLDIAVSCSVPMVRQRSCVAPAAMLYTRKYPIICFRALVKTLESCAVNVGRELEGQQVLPGSVLEAHSMHGSVFLLALKSLVTIQKQNTTVGLLKSCRSVPSWVCQQLYTSQRNFTYFKNNFPSQACAISLVDTVCEHVGAHRQASQFRCLCWLADIRGFMSTVASEKHEGFCLSSYFKIPIKQ